MSPSEVTTSAGRLQHSISSSGGTPEPFQVIGQMWPLQHVLGLSQANIFPLLASFPHFWIYNHISLNFGKITCWFMEATVCDHWIMYDIYTYLLLTRFLKSICERQSCSQAKRMKHKQIRHGDTLTCEQTWWDSGSLWFPHTGNSTCLWS